MDGREKEKREERGVGGRKKSEAERERAVFFVMCPCPCQWLCTLRNAPKTRKRRAVHGKHKHNVATNIWMVYICIIYCMIGDIDEHKDGPHGPASLGLLPVRQRPAHPGTNGLLSSLTPLTSDITLPCAAETHESSIKEGALWCRREFSSIRTRWTKLFLSLYSHPPFSPGQTSFFPIPSFPFSLSLTPIPFLLAPRPQFLLLLLLLRLSHSPTHPMRLSRHAVVLTTTTLAWLLAPVAARKKLPKQVPFASVSDIPSTQWTLAACNFVHSSLCSEELKRDEHRVGPLPWEKDQEPIEESYAGHIPIRPWSQDGYHGETSM